MLGYAAGLPLRRPWRMGMALAQAVKAMQQSRQERGHEPRFPDAFGAERIRAGWIGIGIAGAAFLMVGGSLLSVGAPEPLLAVGPILLVFALICAVTRRVELDPVRGEVLVIRRLGPLRWVRRWSLRHATAVAVTLTIAKPKHSPSDGTLAGDQIHACYEVRLEGLMTLRIADFYGGPDPPARREAAEGLALALAGWLGVPAERRGYRLERWDGGMISAPARNHVEPIPGDPLAAAAELEERLAMAGHGLSG
jgi:hypothetical protein